jgi:hypothetical protein
MAMQSQNKEITKYIIALIKAMWDRFNPREQYIHKTNTYTTSKGGVILKE